MADLNDYVIPLFEVLIDNNEIQETPKFLGMAFNIDKSGVIATCAHLFSDLDPKRSVITIQMFDYQCFPVEDIKKHEKYDFAIATIKRPVDVVLPFIPDEKYLAGLDVMAYGVNSNGIIGKQLDLCPRLMKGHIVRISKQSPLTSSRSICEISFPSLSGFSGTPIITTTGSQQYVAGMLHSNYESSIELYKITNINDTGDIYNEQIHRIYEFGLAHTPSDIRQFLKELGYQS